MNETKVIYYYICFQKRFSMLTNAIDRKKVGRTVDFPFNAYYPFGKQILNLSRNPSGQELRYNGKELQTQGLGGRALDWYDYGARFYDPTLGRWHSVDPLAEMDVHVTPFNYVRNNPIILTDPDGQKWVNPYQTYINDNPELDPAKLKALQYMSSLVDTLLGKLKKGDEEMYNFFDNLTVTDENGNVRDVELRVSLNLKTSGSNGEEGEKTVNPPSTTEPTVFFDDQKIFSPIFNDKISGKIFPGFNITIYGIGSTRDNHLASECGDVAYYMFNNQKAVKSQSSGDAMQNVGNSEYLKNPKTKFSNAWEEVYKIRKNTENKKDGPKYQLQDNN